MKRWKVAQVNERLSLSGRADGYIVRDFARPPNSDRRMPLGRQASAAQLRVVFRSIHKTSEFLLLRTSPSVVSIARAWLPDERTLTATRRSPVAKHR